MARGEQLAHITSRNAPTNNPYNTSHNAQRKIRMASGKWLGAKRKVGTTPIRS